MYTLYQSISATLPQTAYLKMIDYWLLGGLIIPFIVFNILIVIDILVLQNRNQVVDKYVSDQPTSINVKAKKILTFFRIAIPVSTTTIIIVYWSIALYVSS